MFGLAEDPTQNCSQAGPHIWMVAPFSFKHTGMHCLAQSERDSASLTEAIVITKQISRVDIIFFDATIVEIFSFIDCSKLV